MKPIVYLFAPTDQVNEATSYYIGTIARAVAATGSQLCHVESVSHIPVDADVLVVECKSAFILRCLRPMARYWIWLQGIVPEEARLHMQSRWREALWNAFERLTLNHAAGLIMVSTAMRRHYLSKYPKLDVPSFVMPCVNAGIEPDRIRNSAARYRKPAFVYAGSMHAWQGIELALASFAAVQKRIPNAELTLLTREHEKARRELQKANISNAEIRFVPLDKLQEELAHFKYGFVLRDDHIVNRVATPTKVSSYMAAGVIPIMTDAVEDYAAELKDVDPIVMVQERTAEVVASEVLKIESSQIDPQFVLNSYQSVFDRYFDHDRYVDALSVFLIDTGS